MTAQRAALALVVLIFTLAETAIGASRTPVIVIDPGHDLRANLATEPIGPGSSTRKIKDGGGTHGVVSGLTEAELNLKVALRLRGLLERAGVRVVMTGRRRQERASATSRGLVSRTGGRSALSPHPR
jgi:N-acetylmuramoyl-L-alanine amidase